MTSFPCSSCGACCRNISQILELKEFDMGNGICKYLDKKSNLCTIYKLRPTICCIDAMYENNYSDRVEKEEFYRVNIDACNTLQELCGVDKKFRLSKEGDMKQIQN